MDCSECQKLERLFLESMVAADRAETDLRCYFLTHQWGASVSERDEYESLRRQHQGAAEERHKAYVALVEHTRTHPPGR